MNHEISIRKATSADVDKIVRLSNAGGLAENPGRIFQTYSQMFIFRHFKEFKMTPINF